MVPQQRYRLFCVSQSVGVRGPITPGTARKTVLEQAKKDPALKSLFVASFGVYSEIRPLYTPSLKP